LVIIIIDHCFSTLYRYNIILILLIRLYCLKLLTTMNFLIWHRWLWGFEMRFTFLFISRTQFRLRCKHLFFYEIFTVVIFVFKFLTLLNRWKNINLRVFYVYLMLDINYRLFLRSLNKISIFNNWININKVTIFLL
jgi:hypothetical protein